MTVTRKALSAVLQVPEGYVDVPAHDVAHAAESIYSYGFEDSSGAFNAGGWSNAVQGSTGHAGSAWAAGPSNTSSVTFTKTLSGLAIGAPYVFSVWAWSFNPVNLSLGVAGIGSSAAVVTTQSFKQYTYTFTATAASHDLQVISGGSDYLYFDDVNLTQEQWTEHVPDHIAYTAALDAGAGNATLDEGWAPYGQASLTVAIPSDTVLNLLDPRASRSVAITAEQSSWSAGTWSDWVSRELTLLVRGRVVDHNAQTVTLTLTTDEALLQDARLVATAPDTSLLPYQSSVRSLCAQVLARHGFALAAGTPDADFTTLTSVTNLAPNGAFRVDTTGWTAGGNSGTRIAVTGLPNGLAWAIRASFTSAVSGGVFNGGGESAGATAVSVTGGKVYTTTLWVRSSVAKNVQLNMEWVSSSGTGLGSTTSPVFSIAANTWTLLWAVHTAPATAARVGVYSYVNGSTWASGNTYDATGLMVLEGDVLETDGSVMGYFDGDTATTASYTYAWAGTAHQSTSTRTPRFSRTPDALTQQPGTSDWGLLTPVLQQTGLRLFCDETGTWRLVDNTYSVYGRVTVSEGFNAYRAQDTINRDQVADDGTPLWFDACVIKYSWIDSKGVQQVAWDAYSVSGHTQVAYFEKAYAYPGPGMAQYYVTRVNGHGRTLALTAAVDFLATPGMEVVSSLAGTEDQSGYVSSVAWDFGADEMTVGTRGLVDTPSSAWIELAPGESWLASPTGASWTSETV